MISPSGQTHASSWRLPDAQWDGAPTPTIAPTTPVTVEPKSLPGLPPQPPKGPVVPAPRVASIPQSTEPSDPAVKPTPDEKPTRSVSSTPPEASAPTEPKDSPTSEPTPTEPTRPLIEDPSPAAPEVSNDPVLVAGPEPHFYFQGNVNVFTEAKVHCALLDNESDLSYRITSVSFTPLEGDSFSTVSPTAEDCSGSGKSEPAGPCTEITLAPGSFCEFAIQAPSRDGHNHRARLVITAEGICTDRKSAECAQIPSDRKPTAQNPIRVQWKLANRTIVACHAVDRPADRGTWPEEDAGKCPEPEPDSHLEETPSKESKDS
ncbi:hypothetical protein [Kineosporia babensis]|uniref:Uncharacterized protein n=1 Tax=Kineosporia babensis TaxID=499548 RepID=A0A9X1NH93_9ACTN|nr:hypothetical protein [Kineosporia babensis]MCD5313236.1 hypothetical protein [Kineosporia babensis]